MSPYEINLLIEDKARLVTGPVVSSDRITSKKGPKSTNNNILVPYNLNNKY